jgi:hypothetical protein
VNVPISERGYDARFCPPTGCIVSKIAEFKRTLCEPGNPPAQQLLALRFLIHLVPDLHQPLHVGGRWDRGGNDLQVRFFGEGTNLHQVWDFQVIERHSIDEHEWRRILESAIDRKTLSLWSRGSEIDWANESLEAARLAYRSPQTGAPLKPGARLDEAYYEFALPLVKQRLAQSAVRLATILNQIAPPK